jgi:hypothetical protein
MYCARCDRHIVTTDKQSWGVLAGYYKPVHRACANPDELVKVVIPAAVKPIVAFISQRPIFVRIQNKIRGWGKYQQRYKFRGRHKRELRANRRI